jgi:ribonuclease HI
METSKANMPHVTIYTDGGCDPNPGLGSWAYVLVYGKHQKEGCGVEESSTNNRAEYIAMIEGMKALKRPCRVTIVTDSMNNVFLLRAGRVKSHKRKHQDLVNQILDLMDIHVVDYQIIKGHSGVVGNERCDQLCHQARRDFLKKFA